MLCGRPDGGPPGPGVTDEDRGATQFTDQCDPIRGGWDCAIAWPADAAVAVATNVHRCNSVSRTNQPGRKEAVAAARVAHAVHADDQARATGPRYVVGDAAACDIQE